MENSHWIWKYPDHPYAGRTAVLATKHGKLPLIGPILEESIGLKVVDVEVDTDVLGTFTGDVERRQSPLETAIAKARMGMRFTGETLGLASEGSIGPDKSIPFFISDEEIVVLVDDLSKLIVWESNTSFDIVKASATVSPGDALDTFLAEAEFPSHLLIVRPNSEATRPIWKGIDDLEVLKTAIDECAAADKDGLALVQTDLRAHACPSRQKIILGAAERLAARLMARCPQCKSPGWGETGKVFGVPCSWCGTQIQRPRAIIRGCPSCDFRLIEPISDSQEKADPGECPVCNP